MKNAFTSSKKLFVLEIFKFLYFCPSPFFGLSASALEDDLKVHDANNCLNKNSITHFVW